MINIFSYEIPEDQVEIILVVTGFVFSIIGCIIGFYLKRWHIRYRLKMQNFIKASNEFNNVFDSVRTKLNPLQGQGASGILKEEMPSHKTAYDKFRPLLIKIKGRRTAAKFDQAWIVYYNTKKHGKHPFVEYNNKISGSKEGEEESKRLAISRISNLLKTINQ